MAVRVIPIAPSVPSQRVRVTLDKREYVLDLRWSMREERWYLDLRDSGGVMLVGSIKLVVGFPLLARFRARAGIPPGELLVDDGRAHPADPTLAELGDAAQLHYLDASEFAAAGVAAATAIAASGGTPPPPGEL